MDIIMNWIKEFLIIYLILTILTNLSAADQYKKHIRFFSGVVMLLVLISPVLGLFGESGRLEALISYEAFWETLDSARQDTKKLEFLQNSHYIAKYEQAIAADIQLQAEEQGMPLQRVSVSLSEDYEIRRVTVWPDIVRGTDITEQKEKMLRFLKHTYGLREAQICINNFDKS